MNHAVRSDATYLFCRGFIIQTTNQASCQADGLYLGALCISDVIFRMRNTAPYRLQIITSNT